MNFLGDLISGPNPISKLSSCMLLTQHRTDPLASVTTTSNLVDRFVVFIMD